MRALLISCFGLFMLLHTSSAQAQYAGGWDSKGWVLLGERTVNGHREHGDHIDISNAHGRYSKIMIVVSEKEMTLTDFSLTFAKGDAWHPSVDHRFHEGDRTQGLDLPSNSYASGDRDVTRIDFKYRDADNARIQIYAKPIVQRRAPQWENKGWTLLGEKEISGYGDRERGGSFEVGKQDGRFTKLTVVVLDDDLEITDFAVNFDHGDRWHPDMKNYFRENSATRAIDMPANAWGNDARFIKSIDFKYRNVSDGGHARLQVYGMRGYTAPSWDNKGWTMLGEKTLSGYGTRERGAQFDVGKQEGRFEKLTIVVHDADLELIDFVVNFDHGDRWHPDIKHYFQEGQRTRAFELPENTWGHDARFIKSIEFKYRNVPESGSARIQVWGLRAAEQAETPWDDHGWTSLGDQDVNSGRRDEDSVRFDVGGRAGRFTKIALVVRDAEMEVTDVKVKFGNGDDWHPEVRHSFRRNARAKVLDLPDQGNRHDREIKYVEIRYRGHARIKLYGVKYEGGGGGSGWNSDGWTMLGEREVKGHGREVKDRIDVGHGEGKFSEMTIVVLDSDLEIIGMSVAFGRGEPWRPELKHEFKEGQRSRRIDFPASERGNEERTIRWIDFTYRNLPGEGHARVQVWAR